MLLDIRTNYQQATKEIAQYTTEIAKLKDEKKELVKAMDMLRAANQTETEQYKELANRLAANEESQKAYRKEIQEVSRSVQNAIIAEGKYADTLKGKAAQLSIEKDKLRQIKIAHGALSAEYKAQEKVVADLNAEVMALERNYGTHTRNVGNYESAWGGMLNKLRLGWAALAAVVVKGLKDIAQSFVSKTQQIGDAWKIETEGWKTAYQQFIVSLTRGDGWRELIANMRTAYTEGKRLAAMLDELFERENSLKIEAADIAAEIEREKIATRDVTRSNEDRIKSAERVIELEEQLAARRKDIAQQELDIRRQQITTLTGMSEAEIDYFVNNYNNNRDLINEAIRYNEVMQKQRDIIKAANREAALQSAGTANVPAAGTSAFGQARQRIADARAVMAELESTTSDSVREVAAVAAKYSMTNDDMIRSYVDAYTKYQQVDADLFKLTSRTQVQRSALIKQMMNEGEQAVTAQTQNAQVSEQNLKDQSKAMQEYVRTVTGMLERLLGGEGPEAEIRQIEEEYRQLTLNLQAQVKAGNITFEEATYYRVALAQKEGEEIRAVRQRAADEEKKNREQQAADEARARQEQLNTDLQIAWDNADEQFRIKRDYLLRELELYKDNAGKRAELEQQLTELMRQEQERKLEMIMDYASQVGDLMSNTNQVLTNLGEQEVHDVETRNEKEKAALDKRLAGGLISQRQYDQKVKQMDKELDAEKAAIARRQAIRERSAALFSVAMSTAQAIMKVWAEVPVYLAPVMTALVAANGLAQTAAIISEPLPKARKGGKIEGASHEQGGVLVEAEGDERIVAAQPARAFPELLNLISYIGKHGGVPQTGYDIRHGGADGIDYERMGDIMRQAVSELQIWLSLRELRDAEQTQVKIDQLSKL